LLVIAEEGCVATCAHPLSSNTADPAAIATTLKYLDISGTP
jgi:hypothetical protein